jgi:hypothetical protein
MRIKIKKTGSDRQTGIRKKTGIDRQEKNRQKGTKTNSSNQ